MNKPVITSVFFFLTLSMFAEPPLLDEGEKQSNFKLPSTFSFLKLDPKQSSGSLTFKTPEKKDVYKFGPESNFVGTGFIFRPEFVPAAYRKNLNDSRILQILIAKKNSNVPFLTVMLQADDFKSAEQTFKVVTEGGESKRAWILVESPFAREAVGNEEVLKNNFFGSQGLIKTKFVGKPAKTEVTLEEKDYPFQTQKLTLNFNAIVTTPFNPTKGELTGNLTLPITWVEDEGTIKQLKKLLTDAPPGEKTPKSKQEGIQHHKREISGTTRDK